MSSREHRSPERRQLPLSSLRPPRPVPAREARDHRELRVTPGSRSRPQAGPTQKPTSDEPQPLDRRATIRAVRHLPEDEFDRGPGPLVDEVEVLGQKAKRQGLAPAAETSWLLGRPVHHQRHPGPLASEVHFGAPAGSRDLRSRRPFRQTLVAEEQRGQLRVDRRIPSPGRCHTRQARLRAVLSSIAEIARDSHGRTYGRPA